MSAVRGEVKGYMGCREVLGGKDGTIGNISEETCEPYQDTLLSEPEMGHIRAWL